MDSEQQPGPLTGMDANASRVAVLETLTKANASALERLEKESDRIRDTVHRIEVAQAARASVPVCPAPGKCMDLEKQLTALTASVASLVSDRAEARGAMKMAVFLAAGLSGVVSAAVSYGFHLANGGHKP